MSERRTEIVRLGADRHAPWLLVRGSAEERRAAIEAATKLLQETEERQAA